MTFRVDIESAARRNIRNLPKQMHRRIDPVIRALAEDPFPEGCRPLRGYHNIYRIRVGDFRIIYRVHEQKLIVLVIRVGHRREVYRGMR